jgi:predicted dehydrogenase
MKVALVGAGRIGRVHADAVRRQTGISRLVVCDPDGQAAARAASDFNAASYDDVERMLAAEQPDVLHVCTPPATHARVALAALAAGAHVLVEKPMVLAHDDVVQLAAALRDRPGALCVDHNFLFEPEMITARRWISAGAIGEVVAAEMFYGVDSLPGEVGPGAWSQALPGGRFTDLLPHGLYLLMHFLGDARGVVARRGRRPGAPTASELGVILDCERGLGTIRVSLAAAPWELGLTLRGTAGTVRVDLARQRAVIARHRGGRLPRKLAQLVLGLDVGAQTAVGSLERVVGKLNGRLNGYPGLRTLVTRFYASVRAGLPPPVSFDDGARVVAAIERIRTSLDDRGSSAKGGVVVPLKHRA